MSISFKKELIFDIYSSYISSFILPVIWLFSLKTDMALLRATAVHKEDCNNSYAVRDPLCKLTRSLKKKNSLIRLSS